MLLVSTKHSILKQNIEQWLFITPTTNTAPFWKHFFSLCNFLTNNFFYFFILQHINSNSAPFIYYNTHSYVAYSYSLSVHHTSTKCTVLLSQLFCRSMKSGKEMLCSPHKKEVLLPGSMNASRLWGMIHNESSPISPYLINSPPLSQLLPPD